jgi:Flp pilus assembly protein TadG
MILPSGRATTRPWLGSRRDEGQTIAFVAVIIPVLIGMLGLTIDVGRLYIAKRHLQTATDAAALAAAEDLPSGTQALISACTFSATPAGGACPSGTAATSGKNYRSELGNVSTAAKLECLSAASAGSSCATGTGCTSALSPAGNSSNLGCNAIKVTQSTTVNTFLLGLLGIGSRTVTASSTATMGGGRSAPLDIEVVIDSTASMQTFDNCGASPPTSGVAGIPYAANSTPTAEDCAKAGVRALLETLHPCSPSNPQSSISCGSAISNNYSDPEDEVGLMTVPPPVGNPNAANYVSPGNGLGIPAETNCIEDLAGSNPKYFSTSPSNYASAQSPQYEIVPLSSDYKLNNATTPANDALLNPDSNLVKAVYWGQCPGGIYPTNGGTQGSSLSTPGSNDYSTADNNNSTAIAGGPNVSGYSTKTTNGSGGTISGFPAAGNSSVTNGASAQSTISIARPGTPAADDYVIVALTTTGAGASGAKTSLICAPDSTWTELSQSHDGSGGSQITQAVFGSVRTSASAESYTFKFVNGASCTTSPSVSLKSSVVAVRYAGVDPYDPVDAAGTPNPTSNVQGKTLTPPQITTTHANDRVVSIYSDRATAFKPALNASRSITQAGGTNVTGLLDAVQAGPATVTPATASTTSSRRWVAEAIALKPKQGSTSISVTRPTPAAANDYVVVSITATDVGSSGTLYVCPPSDGTWTAISEKTQGSGAGAITQATFGSLRSGSSDPAYAFTFVSGTSCSATLPASVEASAVAVRYTGVNVGNPIDASGSPAGGSSGTSGSALTTPTVQTNHANAQVIRVYSDASASVTLQNGQQAGQSQTSSGQANVTVVTDKSQQASGSTATATATTTSAHNWVAQTIALEPQQGQASITINRPSNSAAGDVVVVAVTVQGNVKICAPDSSWIDAGTGAVSSGSGPADVTEEAFYSYRGTLDPSGQSYTFSFKNGSCSGAAVTRPATAVAVRYAGANPVAPIDTTASRIGSGTALTTATVATGNVNDAVVSFYGAGATSFSSGVVQSASSSDTASGLETYVQTAPGQTSSQSATATSSAAWVALTVAIAAADAGCSGQCTYGLEDPGGASTYYADAITAAKAALDAAPASRSDAEKVIILLSDGVANTFTSTPCQDAISNAIAAETASANSSAATVYSIAYGSYTDACTDSQSVITNVPMNGACAMRLVADNPHTDTTHAGVAGGTIKNAQNALCSGTIASDPSEHFYAQPSGSNLASVFRAIGLSLTSPRLVSDDAT